MITPRPAIARTFEAQEEVIKRRRKEKNVDSASLTVASRCDNRPSDGNSRGDNSQSKRIGAAGFAREKEPLDEYEAGGAAFISGWR